MRIAVVTSHVPFVEGGHLVIARSTVAALREHGHEAELFLTPQNRFSRIFQAYLATRMTDLKEDGLGRKIDEVISFRYPSYAVKHPLHVNWLNHTMREYYDLWESFSRQLSVRGRLKEGVKRKLIHCLDSYLLKHNVTKIYAQSKTIQERLRRWGNIPSELLYPPPPPRPYFTEKYGNFVLAVSRLQKLKRFDLLLKSVARLSRSSSRILIIGDGPERENLQIMAREAGLENTVSFAGWVEEETLLRAYAECRVVFFGPYQEDYGLVTLEAFYSRKPVVTCTDSGGPAELVAASGGGLICSPEPDSIAQAIDKLITDPSLAEKLGEKGFTFSREISWEKTVGYLTLSSQK